jgi:AcrR family transcriptional regulator
MPRARTPKKYHHGDLRQALVQATLTLVEEHDVSAVSLREVARRAGVSPGAPYHHFKTKSELLSVVAEEGFHACEAAMYAALVGISPADPYAQIDALGVGYLRFASEHPSHYRVMFHHELSDPALYPERASAADRAMSCLAEVLRKFEGLSPQEIERLALAFWSFSHGIASLWIEGPLRRKLPGLQPFAAQALGAAVRAMIPPVDAKKKRPATARAAKRS